MFQVITVIRGRVRERDDQLSRGRVLPSAYSYFHVVSLHVILIFMFYGDAFFGKS